MKRLPPALLTLIKFIIALALLSYLTLSGVIDWSSWQRFASMWQLGLVALGLLLGAAFANALRLYVLFKAPGLALSYAYSLRLTLIGLFFNACLPGGSGGDLVRMYYASAENGGRRAETVSVIVLDRVVGILALLLVPLIVIALLPGLSSTLALIQQIAWGGAVAAIGILVVLVLGLKLLPRAPSFSARLLKRLRVHGFVSRLAILLRAYGEHPDILFGAIAISLISHGLTIVSTLLIAQAMIPAGLNPIALALIPIGFVVNALPLTPGGLGIGEVAFSRLFALVGATGGAETLLGWRLLTILLGLVGLVLYVSGRRQLKVELNAPAAQPKVL